MTVPDTLTSQERRVVRAAARQFVRYDDWHAAVREAASDARWSGIATRRALDEFLRSSALPKKPEDPTDEERSAFDDERLAYRRLRTAAASDTRPPKSEERRNQPFKEQTGDGVVETLTNGDGRRWAKLACRAIALAADPKFRESCGHAVTMSELHAAEEVAAHV